jgi:Fic family protein
MEMNKTPDGEEELINLLKNRHAVLLEGRPELDPGIFKTRKNQAGNTYFVEPGLVEGTLKFGFKLYKALNNAFAKAIYMMFICSEIHPFNDGNGRVSRIMMNAELVRANQTRIIVPTVYREDYILSLRRLSRQKDPSVFIDVMLKLQQFSNNIYGKDFSKIVEYLHLCQAFEEPDEGKLQFIEANY